jgi:hypothetical protein
MSLVLAEAARPSRGLFHALTATLAAMPTPRQNQMPHLLAGIEKQISDAEKRLLRTTNTEDVRRVAERIAHLKVARQNIKIVIDADEQSEK